jgi:hypothetical protein
MPSVLVRQCFHSRFGQVIDRAFITEDEAFYWTAGQYRASELSKMDAVGLGMVLAEVDSLAIANPRPFVEIFGVSRIAIAIQTVDLALII